MDEERWSPLGFASLTCKKGLNLMISCCFYYVVIVECPKEGGEKVGMESLSLGWLINSIILI